MSRLFFCSYTHIYLNQFFNKQVIRPFFGVQDVARAPTESKVEKSGASPSVSSEGFTSFFTTTANSGSNESSDMDKKCRAREGRAADDLDDASSMVVLARVKRKHRRQPQAESGESSETQGSNNFDVFAQKRVRIVEIKPPGEEQPPPLQLPEQQESNDSSSSNNIRRDVAAELRPVNGVPPRIVTDVSSSNRTDSAKSSAGSGGNTGSGSNQESGSGLEEKGSSEDLPKDATSGDNLAASDAISSEKPPPKAHHHHQHNRHDDAPRDADMPESPGEHTWPNATREKKILDKKRKRREKRREFEAQQQLASSESSNATSDSLFRPGKAVTMEQVLQFSQTPR